MTERTEDKTTISRFLIDNFEIDQADFVGKFTKYKDPFLKNTKDLITTCEAIVASSFYVTQLKTLTRLVDVTAISIRGDLNDIELMAINAGSKLNMNWKDMGFREARKCISNTNLEGLQERMKILNENIKSNLVALTDEGDAATIWTSMKGKVAQVKTMNEEQNKMIAAKAKTIKENNDKFEEMWDVTLNLMRAGKVIYKTTNPTRVKEYTLTTLTKRVRHDGSSKVEKKQKLDEQLLAKKGELELTVKDFGVDESWVEDVEVEIQGTEFKVLTDDEGVTLLDLPEGTYIVILRKETYEDQVLENVKIKAGETTEMMVELKGIA